MAWAYWTAASSTSTIPASTISPVIWQTWTSSTTSFTIDGTWNTWNAWQTSATGGWDLVPYAQHPTPSPEERRRERRQQGIAEAKRLAAARKARALLLSVLDDEQRHELETRNEITVRTRTGRRFCLDARRRQHNAFELDAAGRRVREYCIHAPHHIPQDDHLAAQVLMLGLEEEEFDRIANVWDLTGNRRTPVR